MNKKVINLYTTVGCPKCEILRKRCAESAVIADSDFKEIVIDPNNDNDTDLQLLIEHSMVSFPVLLVDNDFMDFGRAMRFV